ncbi:MAG TPA: type II secretion system protein [Planctomycetota bacterium]|nr:type II secretion system protein [Planctomycetota bacterium]
MRRHERAHTLVELLVAVTISSLLVNVAMMAWRPISHSTLTLRDRAADETELRLAVEALLADLGGAQTALPTAGGELRIVREQAVAELAGAWDGSDDGISWSLQDGKLVRLDLALGTELVVAAGLTDFDVTRPGGTETHVLLGIGADDDARTLELVWPQ